MTSGQLSTLASLTGVKFNANNGSNTGPHVSFDRPEKSTCLIGLSGDEYDQALAIIQQGADNLAATPRADMPGHVPCAADQTRLDKYDMRQIIEWINRQAIREGWLYYDGDPYE